MMSENKMPSEALPVSDGILLNLILYRYYCVNRSKIKYSFSAKMAKGVIGTLKK